MGTLTAVNNDFTWHKCVSSTMPAYTVCCVFMGFVSQMHADNNNNII